ncbi:glycoside hydrolase family 2 protein [uncultured Psychroserpens sp.]|uniref:beta-mannosidase n=1 Tax=uncultured Psychroserpens sp. TaxID=255436 RepID=UPI002626FB08|nr:glycoside hydrolase family 2 protein [uncultured Psychroserpens sp.]
MKTYSILVITVLMLMSCQPKHDVPVVIDLHSNWSFKAVNDSLWNTASVPGNVHSDLLNNKRIEHPFIGANEDSLQWISDTDWEYKTSFSVAKETLNKKHLSLNFKGLDTYASVFLNDSLILKTNNAFREFSVDVKSILASENNLRIVFERTSISEEHDKEKLNYQLPEGHRIFTRKAQFQYGWDWGPKLNTTGIWRPVTLNAWNDFKLESIQVTHQKSANSITKLFLDIKKISSVELDKNLAYEIYINDELYKTSEDVFKGYSWTTQVDIKNPNLWWPHNLGDPYLYDIKVVVKNGNNILDSISTKKGIRTVELVTEKDSHGESFYFKVNGIAVYMKGANYIPQNSMQNQVTDAHYEKLLDDVVDANMNMLRVWGGGIYENDIFYDLCDEKGILVWQDFMFACAMYPGDKAFLENIQLEATQNVKRLSNHASIVLWCGNNENSEGWHRWGWQANRSDEEKEDIWNNYLKVFDSILPNTVKGLTDIPYWESSPKYGRGNPKYKTEGDAHDWWIWHDAYPFEHLEKNVPRFMSEFGFQSFPSYEAIRYINQSDTINITSESFKNHQKHVRGFQLIDEYMQRDFPVPTNAEDYVYVSQLLQAYGITKGIEAHRRARPYNMGTLYWQLNDCWPAVSWSSIDYFGNWKALHYHAKKSFDNIIVSTSVENNNLKTYLINDGLKQIDVHNEFQMIFNFDGDMLWSHNFDATLYNTSSILINELDLKGLDIDYEDVYVLTTLNDKSYISYLAKPKDLKLKKAPVNQTIAKTQKGFKIFLHSTTLQKNVFLQANAKGHFSDNYFDLKPSEILEIEFETDAEHLDGLKIKTLNDLIN